MRGTALEDIADIDIVAGQAHAFGKDVVEELSSPADKRHTLLVLIITGGLADKDQAGVGVALAEDHVGAGLGEGTLLAITELGLEGLEDLAFLLGSGLRKVRAWPGLVCRMREFVRIKGDGLGTKEEVGFHLLKAGSARVVGGLCGHKWLPSIAE